MDRIRTMRAFEAVADAGSFTAAAERLGASNKVVSKMVGALEDRLGVRLLHRTTRQLSLTEEGHRYLEGVRRVLADLEVLETSLGADRDALSGKVRLSAPSTFGELHLGRLVRDFCRDHPAVEVDLRLTDRFVDLAEDGFDLALRIGALADSSLVARKLAETRLWVVAAPSFVAEHGRPSSPGDLSSLPAVQDGNLRGGQVWPLGDVRVPVRARITANSARSVAALAAEGEGVALCPDYVAAPLVAEGRLVRLLADHETPSLDIHVVYLANRHLPARTRAMIERLAARLGQAPWLAAGT